MRMIPRRGDADEDEDEGRRFEDGEGWRVREVPRRDRDVFFVQHVCDIIL